MPKYSKPMDPYHAISRFSGQAGNYVLHFKDGTAYAGRQGVDGRRLETHLRRHRDLTAVQFMTDRAGNSCVRATRERLTVGQLQERGVSLRNLIQPSLPLACSPRVRVNVHPSAPAGRGDSTAAVVLAGVGLAGLFGLLIAAARK